MRTSECHHPRQNGQDVGGTAQSQLSSVEPPIAEAKEEAADDGQQNAYGSDCDRFDGDGQDEMTYRPSPFFSSESAVHTCSECAAHIHSALVIHPHVFLRPDRSEGLGESLGEGLGEDRGEELREPTA